MKHFVQHNNRLKLDVINGLSGKRSAGWDRRVPGVSRLARSHFNSIQQAGTPAAPSSNNFLSWMMSPQSSWRSVWFNCWRLPEFDPVSLWIADPCKATVVRIINLFDCDALLAQNS